MSLLDRRLLVVSGKGGVGKTAVAGAIALAAARSGRRTLVVEVASQQRLARVFGEAAADPYQETPLFPGLTGLSVEPQRALEEYLSLALRVRALAERLAESKAFGYVAAATPGLRELVTLGKVWHLAEERTHDGEPRYELIVVDAPATGHGIGFLRSPRTFADLARVGRIHTDAKAIADLVWDPARTAIVLVTLAEEMPVAETADALGQLGALGLAASAVVVNGLYPKRFSAAERGELPRLEPAGETARAALLAARSHVARREEQTRQLRRLARATGLPRVELPFLFQPVLDLDGLTQLADVLGPALAEVP